MSGPPLRVVVVTYAAGETLGVFLDSLRGACSTAYDVVVVDNGPPDPHVRTAAERPEVTVVRPDRNLGYGGAANVGAAAASLGSGSGSGARPAGGGADPAGEPAGAGADPTGEPAGAMGCWLLVANPDVRLEPAAVDVLLAAAERWPRAGALGPAILTPQGDLYPSARALPSLGRGVGHALCGWWWPGNPWTRAYRREVGAPVEGPTGWLSGSCLLLRRAAFEEVGGFDPAYFMYFEDTDLGERLGRAGWLSVHVPSAVVEHQGGAATALVSERMLRAHHESAYRYLSRRYAGRRWLPLRMVLAVGLAARYVAGRGIRRVGEGAVPTRPASALRRSD